MKIVADAPNAELIWITTPDCNLDTTQTEVSLKNGKGELSVKWLHQQENGKYAPQSMAFKAWVGFKAGDKVTYVPLVLSERIDSTKLAQPLQTRAGGITPRVVTLRFSPTLVNMQTASGGTSELQVSGVGTVTLDYSQITNAMKIDMTSFPASVTANHLFNFKWVDNLAPETAFSVDVLANSISEGLWASLTLNYDPFGTGGVDLEYVRNNMPAATEKLPATSSIYTFTFRGSYSGGIQIQTLSAGKVLHTATVYQYPGKQPRARVPENTGAERPIQFKYKMEGTALWIPIPDADRIQAGGATVPGTKPSYGPITPEGNIPDAGGKYYCTFSNYGGVVYFRAVSGEGRLLGTTSDIITVGGFKQLSLTIPESTSRNDNQVIFQYSIDGTKWEDIETRTQIVETFASGSFTDMPNKIPVTGGVYHYVSTGTLSALLTIVVKDQNNVVVTETRGAVGGTINVSIPANTTGQPRSLFFWYARGDQPGKFNYIQRGDQAGH